MSVPVVSETSAATIPASISSESLTPSVAETTTAAPSQGLMEMLKGEGMIIVGLTVLSYFAAYWFKSGEYLAHGISLKLVRIELVDGLRAGGHLAMALALALLCYQTVLGARELVADAGRMIKTTLIGATILAVVYAFCWAVLGMDVSEVSSVLMSFALYLGGYAISVWLIVFIVVCLCLGSKEGFRVVRDRMLARTKSSTLYQEMWADALKAKVTIILLVSLVLAFFVCLYGFSSARRQLVFPRLEGTPYIVIDTLNDRLLCKSVNEKQDGLLPGFTLVPMREGEVMSFVSLKLNKKDENTTAPAAPAAVTAPSTPEPASPAASAEPAQPSESGSAPAK